jgi:hypothetical protein
MPLRTEYRFLTHDETTSSGQWIDIFPDGNTIRLLPTRAELTAFADMLEADGWELISVTKRPESMKESEDTPQETWVFRRAHTQ